MTATANIVTLTLLMIAIPSWCLEYQDTGGNPPRIVSAQEEMFFTTVNDDGSGAPHKQEFGIVRNVIQMSEAPAEKPSFEASARKQSFEASNKKPSISSSEADEIPSYYYTELVNEAPWYRLKWSNVSRRNALRENNFGLRSTNEEQPLRGLNKRYNPYINNIPVIGTLIGTNGKHPFSPLEFDKAGNMQPIRNLPPSDDGLYYPPGIDSLIYKQGDVYDMSKANPLSDLMMKLPASGYREEMPKPVVDKWMSYKINMDNMNANVSEKEKFLNKLVHDNVNKFQSLVHKAVAHEQKNERPLPIPNYMIEDKKIVRDEEDNERYHHK